MTILMVETAQDASSVVGMWGLGWVVILAAVWLLSAMMGELRTRPLLRLAAAGALVVASSLLVGMYPNWNVDTGWIGRQASSGLQFESEILLFTVKLVLILASLLAFLVATDWLPARLFGLSVAGTEEGEGAGAEPRTQDERHHPRRPKRPRERSGGALQVAAPPPTRTEDFGSEPEVEHDVEVDSPAVEDLEAMVAPADRAQGVLVGGRRRVSLTEEDDEAADEAADEEALDDGGAAGEKATDASLEADTDADDSVGAEDDADEDVDDETEDVDYEGEWEEEEAEAEAEAVEEEEPEFDPVVVVEVESFAGASESVSTDPDVALDDDNEADVADAVEADDDEAPQALALPGVLEFEPPASLFERLRAQRRADAEAADSPVEDPDWTEAAEVEPEPESSPRLEIEPEPSFAPQQEIEPEPGPPRDPENESEAAPPRPFRKVASLTSPTPRGQQPPGGSLLRGQQALRALAASRESEQDLARERIDPKIAAAFIYAQHPDQEAAPASVSAPSDVEEVMESHSDGSQKAGTGNEPDERLSGSPESERTAGDATPWSRFRPRQKSEAGEDPPRVSSPGNREQEGEGVPAALEEPVDEVLSVAEPAAAELREQPSRGPAAAIEDDDDNWDTDEDWDDDDEEEDEGDDQEEDEEEEEDEDWEEDEDDDSWGSDDDDDVDVDDTDEDDSDDLDDTDDEEDEDLDDDEEEDARRQEPMSSLDAAQRARKDPGEVLTRVPVEERPLFLDASRVLLGTEMISLSRLQRDLGVTYFKAARVFEHLEREGMISPYTGTLAREVQMDRELWAARLAGDEPTR